jgi:hypothetical protein
MDKSQPSSAPSATATATATPPIATPDVYQVHGDGISVTYYPTFVGGLPSLTYHDHQQVKSFRGKEVRKVDVEDLGTIVSVTLVNTVDTGSTSFSLFLPRVNLPNQIGASSPIVTEGVTTVHRLSPIPAANMGQRDVYTVHRMNGTASVQIIPL